MRRAGRLRRRVADRVDVILVWVEHVGAVVRGVIDLADAWRAVVPSARLERGSVKRIDQFTTPDRERYVDATLRRPPTRDNPKERLLVIAEASIPGTGSIRSFKPSGARARS